MQSKQNVCLQQSMRPPIVIGLRQIAKDELIQNPIPQQSSETTGHLLEKPITSPSNLNNDILILFTIRIKEDFLLLQEYYIDGQYHFSEPRLSFHSLKISFRSFVLKDRRMALS